MTAPLALATDSLVLTVALLLAGLGASGIIGLALAGFARRRSRPYLLIVFAVATVLLRTVVAGLSMQGMVPNARHHLAEHLLDVVMVGLVIAAVLTARSASPARERDREN